MTDCPNRFTLAMRAAGDLPPAEATAVDEHLATCAACRSIAAGIDASRADYAERADDERRRLLEAVAREPTPLRAEARRRSATRTAVALSALAAAAALAVVIAAPWETPGGGSAPGVERGDVAFKGGLAFQIVAKRGERQFQVRSGDVLRAGDALRFVLTAPAAGFAAVLCVEGDGRVSAFYPSNGDAWPLRVESPGRAELPGSIILDDSVGAETYAVLFSRSAFSRGAAYAAAADLAKGSPPRGFEGGALGVRKAVSTE